MAKIGELIFETEPRWTYFFAMDQPVNFGICKTAMMNLFGWCRKELPNCVGARLRIYDRPVRGSVAVEYEVVFPERKELGGGLVDIRSGGSVGMSELAYLNGMQFFAISDACRGGLPGVRGRWGRARGRGRVWVIAGFFTEGGE